MPVTRPNIITTGGNISGSGLPSDPVGTNPDVNFRTLVLDSTNISEPLGVSASINGFAEINIKNGNSSGNASSDIVATANNGTDTQYFIDMGINGSGFNGSVGGASDGYLYNTGSHLWIGNATPNKNIYFFAGAVPSAATTTPTMMISASVDGTAGRVGIGTNAPTAKLTVNGDVHISGSNNITFANSGYGIVFGGNAIAGSITDNNLNDYEEGRWNPTLSGSTTAGTYAGTLSGSYIKIGKQVFISGHLQISSTGSAAGSLSITGLPYSSLTYGLSAGSRIIAYIGMMPNSFQNVTTKPVIYGQISNASSRINLYYYYNGQQTALQTTDTNNSFNLYFSGVYPTDS
jgi:hypothetical protein